MNLPRRIRTGMNKGRLCRRTCTRGIAGGHYWNASFAVSDGPSEPCAGWRGPSSSGDCGHAYPDSATPPRNWSGTSRRPLALPWTS